jgi:hypothetical protein
VNILLPGDVADDAVGSRMIACDAVDALAGARDEGDTCSPLAQLANEREAETGGPAGNGNSQSVMALLPLATRVKR